MKPRILFDVGGVLARLDYARCFEAWATLSDQPVKTVQERYTDSGVEAALNAGIITTGEWSTHLRRILRTAAPHADIARGYTNVIQGPIDEMIALKNRLIDANHDVGILSNISPIIHSHCDNICADMLKTHNAPTFLSYREGIAKPNLDAYTPFGEGAHNIFIDDKLGYLERPLSLGWRCIHFTGHVDPNEVARHAGYSERKLSSPNLKTVKTVEELERTLRTWNVC